MAQFPGGPVERLGCLGNLLPDDAQLLAHAAVRIVNHQIQIEDAGFNIAEQLPQIVRQVADDLFGSCGGGHVERSKETGPV
jgi:hypothetical protein